MERMTIPRRAQRYHVSWPARVRQGHEGEWHECQTVNLSVSGVLLRTQRELEVGEHVEVEIEFLASVRSKSIIAGAGQVVRLDSTVPGGAAIWFLTAPSGMAETAIAES